MLLGLHSFVYRDYGVLGYPFVFHSRESFWRGELPLWNPLSNCGAPFLAQWGTMVCYPPSLLYLLFPLPWSLSYFCLGHVFLGGLGMYLLANRWCANRFAATVAGLVYVFNGVSFSCLMWPNYAVALCWMPWVVWANERCWREGRSWLVIAALVATLQLLAGVPEVVLLTWLLVGALLVRHLWMDKPSRKLSLLRAPGVILLSAGLAAVQLLPFLDLLLHSQRDSNFSSAKWPMPTWGWANLLVPLFRCFETPQGPFFQHGQHFLSSYYLGIGILVLAFWAAWSARESRVWILAGATFLSLALALGENGPLFPWLKGLIPVISLARYPIKFVILAAFAVPLLAAYALSRLESDGLEPRTRRGLLLTALPAAGSSLLILWLARSHPYPYDQWNVTLNNGLTRLAFLGLIVGGALWLSRRPQPAVHNALRFALAGLCVLDILTHTPNQNPTVPAAVFAPGLWAENHPGAAPRHGSSRAFITPAGEHQLLNSGVQDLQEDFLGKRLALWSNLNLLEAIPKINGSSTLQLREQMQVQKLIYEQTNAPPIGLLNFLGASIETDPNSVLAWTARTNFAPLITAGQKAVFAPPQETLHRLVQPTFDPRTLVYLPMEAASFVSATNPARARIVQSQNSAQRLEAVVEADQPAMVVVAQSFYHPWRARIDGQPATLWPANHAFQALEMPAGRHRISLAYEDLNLKSGAAISASTLLAAFLLLHRGRSRSIRACAPRC